MGEWERESILPCKYDLLLYTIVSKGRRNTAVRQSTKLCLQCKTASKRHGFCCYLLMATMRIRYKVAGKDALDSVVDRGGT